MPGRDDALGNGRDLRRSLSLAEDNLRESLAEASMVVDFRESEVLERGLAQILKQPDLRSLRCNGSRGDLVKQGAKLQAVHDVAGASSLLCGEPSCNIIVLSVVTDSSPYDAD